MLCVVALLLSTTHHSKHNSTYLSFSLGCSECRTQRAWKPKGYKLFCPSVSPLSSDSKQPCPCGRLRPCPMIPLRVRVVAQGRRRPKRVGFWACRSRRSFEALGRLTLRAGPRTQASSVCLHRVKGSSRVATALSASTFLAQPVSLKSV